MDGTAVSFGCGDGSNTTLARRGVFIGLGVYGTEHGGAYNMPRDIPLCVYNKPKSRAEELVAQGAFWCDTVGELAARSDVVITMVGFPRDCGRSLFW
jgi:3-hydroxyisobutyrate dehydrogenase-like beta-hydroxyacid dehydrogenase